MDLKQLVKKWSQSFSKQKENDNRQHGIGQQVLKKDTDDSRRHWLLKFAAGSGAALGLAQTVHAHKVPDEERNAEDRFPGDPPQHFIVYQLNEADLEYHQHVLGSVGAMIGKYEDNIDIVVACFGRGLHVVAKNPARPVDDSIKEKVKSLAGQGVKFHACNRTMTSLNWGKEDILPFAKIVDVGVADIMELQEKNYAYFAW